VNFIATFPYLGYIYPAIIEFSDFYQNFQPYEFTPLLHAQKGIPLTADEFNKLIDAIVELANESNIKLKSQLNHVQHDQIVKSSQFSNLIYAVNQLLTFNYNTYFLLSCTGHKFSNLLSKQNTFLNVLIGNLKYSITISSNTYIKNFLIYQTSELIISYGSIANLVIKINFGGILLYNYSYINSVNIETDNDGMRFTDYTSANTINIGTENGGIFLYNNAYINTLYVKDNVAGIYLYDNAVIENLICKQNSGGVYISGNAKIINNQCA